MRRFFPRYVLVLVTIMAFALVVQNASAQTSMRPFGAGLDVSPYAHLHPVTGTVVGIEPGYRVLMPGAVRGNYYGGYGYGGPGIGGFGGGFRPHNYRTTVKVKIRIKTH